MKEEAIATTVLAAKKTALSSSLLTSMVIFNDPAYVIIAILGAFVSAGSAVYDFEKIKKEKELSKEKCIKNLWMELGKAFILGALVTMLSFMMFTGMTEEGFSSLNIPWLNHMLPSFWFIVTLMISTESVTIWAKVTNKIRKWLT